MFTRITFHKNHLFTHLTIFPSEYLSLLYVYILCIYIFYALTICFIFCQLTIETCFYSYYYYYYYYYYYISLEIVLSFYTTLERFNLSFLSQIDYEYVQNK